MNADIALPLFVSGRDFADSVADRLGDVIDRTIVVDAAGLLSGTTSFAAQLVSRLLVDGKAAELVVVGAPAEFDGYLHAAAADAGVADALVTTRRLQAAG